MRQAARELIENTILSLEAELGRITTICDTRRADLDNWENQRRDLAGRIAELKAELAEDP